MITNNSKDFEEKVAVDKHVFIGKNDLELQVKKVLRNEIKLLWVFAFDIQECWKVFKSFFKCIDAGGGIVRNDKDEVLFIFRRKKWDLPKGKAERGEQINETALREVEEECGIKVKLDDPEIYTSSYHVYKEAGKYVLKTSYWFLMHIDENSPAPTPQAEEEIEKVDWVHPENFSVVYRNSFFNIIDLCEHYVQDQQVLNL